MFEKVMYAIIVFMSGMLLMNAINEGQHVDEVWDTCPETMICYEPYGAPVEAEYVFGGSIVRVDFVDESELPDDAEAIAEYVPNFEKNFSWCKITTLFPERVLGDPRMDALGHELLHCIIGDFHP